ncbi:hypothetical protein FOZ76_14890 [Verticiella sediminum]|uniref:Uncharacterized protein n=1 Tax=Verticiella sediminum TaxID=1247510 RepID=A0A556AIJ1_9BURK|nr:hypothetical protein [Verticiella sediminum]TSH92699.1 hypothetical protein FOZ76_14890 [Verticiella sediminum]
MDKFIPEQQQLREIIGEMEAAATQPELAPGALEGWQATFQEVAARLAGSPDVSESSDTKALQHLLDRALDLLGERVRGRQPQT